MKAIVFAGIASALLTCGAASAKQQRTLPEMALAGPRPDDYQARVKAWLDDTLKDPVSAQIAEVREPRRASHKVDRGFLGKLWDEPAWWVCYRVNAKNSYGGYTGAHLYMFAFRNGRIASYTESPSPGYGGRDYDNPDVVHECGLSIDDKEGADRSDGPRS